MIARCSLILHIKRTGSKVIKKIIRILCIAWCLNLLSVKLEAFTIDQPGEYTLESSFNETGTVAIIAASNVTLNLAGRTLSGGTGILINSGLSSIIIRNGIINTCSVGISIQESCSFIRLKDIEITNCTDRAIEIVGTSGNAVTGVIMRRLRIHLCCDSISADHVIHIDYADDVILSDCLISKNGTNSVNLRGISMTNSTNGLFEQIKISANEGNTFYGFYVAGADCFFSHCNVRSNIATSTLTGFCFDGGSTTSGNLCTKCYVLNNSSTNGPISGFELLAFVTKNILQQCVAAKNTATAGVSTASCYGFNLDQPTYCSIIKCRALHNSAPGSGVSNICAGFNIGTSVSGDTGTKNCEFTDNFAVGNNGRNDFASYGIRALSSTSSGNSNNAYFSNYAVHNGPSMPRRDNQITSSTGGVPIGSVTSDDPFFLNGQNKQYSNFRGHNLLPIEQID